MADTFAGDFFCCVPVRTDILVLLRDLGSALVLDSMGEGHGGLRFG